MMISARMRGWLRRLATFGATWVWTPILVKGVIWLGAFLALAHVGSEAALQLASPNAASAAPLASGSSPTHDSATGAASGSSRSPSSGASAVGAVAAPCPTVEKRAGSATSDGRLILNLATAEELRRLPGIGAKRAEAILAMRARLGRFRRLRDLLRIRGIGYRSLQKLKPLVVVDEPQAKEAPNKKKKEKEKERKMQKMR